MSSYDVSVELLGMPELRSALEGLADDFRGQVTKQALKDAASVFETGYRNNLANHTGTEPPVKLNRGTSKYELRARIKEVVAQKIWAFPDRTGYAAIIGTISGKAPHAHLLESGTVYRFRHKTGIGGKYKWVMLVKKLKPGDPGTRTAVMPAYHLLQLAYQTNQQQATSVFVVRLQEGIKGRVRL